MKRRIFISLILMGALALIGFVMGFGVMSSEGLSSAFGAGISGAIALPFIVIPSLAILAFPVWVFVKLGRRFGFVPLIGAILMFTPLLPLGALLLFHSKRKG